ncbi:MAG: hypothetical protein R2772_00305 [Chitinophagales bacterium]
MLKNSLIQGYLFPLFLSTCLYSSCRYSACALPEDIQTASACIATMEEVQGMSTYTVILREDEHYLCYFDNPEQASAYGSYSYLNDTLHLNSSCNKGNLLCSSYYINSESEIPGYLLAQPICSKACQGSLHEELWFTWKK